MKRKNKIVIVSYYHFPCFQPVLENIFAKELGREHEIIWLFQGDNSRERLEKWHNSRVVLCRKMKGTSWFTRCINKILAGKKVLLLLFFLMFRDTKIVMIRDMPLMALLIAPLRLIISFRLYFQYSAPLGDITLGSIKYKKFINRCWYLLVGHFFNILIKKVLKTSDLVFPITDFHKKELLRYTHEKKLIPITMGVDEVWLNRERTEIKYLNELKEKHFLITYFGTLGFSREPQFLLNVFDEVRYKCPNCKLVLIGKTHTAWEEKELILTCHNLGIKEHVIFTGYLDRNKLQDYLYYCDVSISPIPPESYYKISSPTKIYESIGNGVPVVANKGIYEQEKVIRESGAGILVDYEVKSFADGIVELLHNSGLRKEMAEKGKHYVNTNYSYKVLAKRILPYFML